MTGKTFHDTEKNREKKGKKTNKQTHFPVIKSSLQPRLRRHVFSLVARVLNVSAVKQILRRRSARVKGMAFSVCRG